MTSPPRVAIVGGGLAGLAAARRLAQRGGIDVTVFEAGERPGGVIETSTAGGFAREHAANGFLPATGGMADLAAELGVPVEAASPAARRRWVYRGGALRPVPGGPADVLRGELLGLGGLMRALGEPFRPVRPAEGSSEETVADFVRRRLGDEVLDALVAPFCTGVYAGDPEQLSLPAAFPTLAALEAEGGLVRGGLGRMLRRLRGQGGPRRPHGRLSSPVGGMAALMAALAREVGPRLRLGAAVLAVEIEGGAAGAARPSIRLADGRRERFDAVVVATPAPVAARLLSDASRELAGLLDRIPYAGVAVVHLGYRREGLVAEPAAGEVGRLDGFGFLVARGEPLRVLGTVFESVLWPDRAPSGHVLLRCILGGVRDARALDLSDRELVDQAHADLRRALGVASAPVHTHVVRWPRAIAQYTLGHRDRVARAEALCDGMGVVLAGASYHGVAVNAIAADASRVAGRVAARLGLSLALAAAVGLGAGCSSGAKSTGASGAAPAGDGGAPHAAASASATGGAAAGGTASAAGVGDAEGGAPAEPPGPPGTVEITVEWLKPPTELVSSGGRNGCGVPLRPPVSVGALGGVEGVVVELAGVPASAAPGKRGKKPRDDSAELLVRGCQVEPRAVRVAGTGATLAVTTLDEDRRELIIDELPRGKVDGGRLARVPLVLVGQRVEVALDKPGLVRVTSVDDRTATGWVVVPDQPYVAVSDERGKVKFDDVPPGKYDVVVWHPPLDDGPDPTVTGRGTVEVTSGAGASATIALARASAPGR